LIEHADEIKQRPAREWFASNADKKNAVLNNAKALKDSAAENNSIKNPTSGIQHRMTRKKRRAREAREAMEKGNDDDHNDNETNDNPSKAAKVNEQTIKSDVKKQKRLRDELKKERVGQSIHDLDMEEEKKLKKKKKKVTASGRADPIGDSSLFGDDRVSYSSKSKSLLDEKPAKSSYKFIGYNPDKKLGKKKSIKSFKSKSKHKRR
jgi:hypothetical protein